MRSPSSRTALTCSIGKPDSEGTGTHILLTLWKSESQSGVPIGEEKLASFNLPAAGLARDLGVAGSFRPVE